MSDYQRIVDDLRNTVLFGGANRESRLDEQLREYGDACRATNDRLRQCEAQLRKGLRSEAIRLCEIEPNLLDLVAVLDFPERGQVAASLGTMGRDLPPLLTAVAADLNEAYAAHRPLESLLSRHRYLALVRAPLRERLAVLRKLNDVDSLNPVWGEDVAIFETERFREIQEEGNRAFAQNDGRKLEGLIAELRSSPWRQTVPPALEQTLEKACRRLLNSRAPEELARLQKELNLAHASGDWQAAEELKTSWNALLLDYTPPPGDPIVQRVEPVMRWLAERGAREAEQAEARYALARLSAALDASPPTDRATLQSLRQALDARGFEVPEILENRYRARIAAVNRIIRNRFLARAGTVAAALALIVAAAVYIIAGRTRADRIGAAFAALGPLVREARSDPEKLPAARKLCDEIQAEGGDVVELPEFRALTSELSKFEDAERKRAAGFRNAMKLATAGGPASPNLGELRFAEDNARTAAEREEIARFRAEIADAAQGVQGRFDQKLLAELEDLKKRLGDLEKLGIEDSRTAPALKTWKADAASLADRHPRAAASLAEGVRPLVARADEIEAAIRRNGGERAALARVLESQWDPKLYISALGRFVQEHPTSARTPDFKRAIAESAVWTKVEDWNNALKTQAALEADPAKRKELVASLDAAITAFATFPQVDRLEARRAFARDRLGRFDENGLHMATALRAPFENPLLSDAWILTNTRGERYFLLRETKKAQGVFTQRIEYVVDTALTQKVALMEPKDIVAIERAPHCLMVAGVVAELDRMRSAGESSWEAGFSKMIRIVLADAKADPVLRLAALRRLVTAAAAGSGPVREAAAAELDVLKNLSTNLLVNWVDPKDADYKAAAQAALQDLARLGDLEVKLAGAEGVAQRLRNELKPLSPYPRRGVLIRDDDGGWVCAPIASEQASLQGSLFVAVPGASGPSLREVGRWTSEDVKLDTANAELLVEGRPVWIAVDN